MISNLFSGSAWQTWSRRILKPVVVAMMAGSLVANAHPGHSLSGTSARHIVTSPYHLAVLTLAGLALFGAARLVKREFPRQLLQLSGATLMLMAVLVWGLRS